MIKIVKSIIFHIAVFVLIVQMAGCGTLIYPERQGQPRGDIDPTVAIIDGIGLLFFVIPGLVAFVVDFHTGAIYLPPGKTTEQRLEELKGSDLRFLKQGRKVTVLFDPDRMTPDRLEQVVNDVAGVGFDYNHPELEVYKINRDSKFYTQFSQFAAGRTGSVLAFN